MKTVVARGPLLAAALLFLLLLCACGAQVDTHMELRTGFSGVRRMACTMEIQELEDAVTGGLPALEAVILEALPEGVAYEMLREEETATALFSISFQSLEEYAGVVERLLQGTAASPEIRFVDCEDSGSLFRSGVLFEEHFTSVDLLQWLAAAVRSAGITSYENPGDYFAPGASTILWNQTPYSGGEDAPLRLDLLRDHSMESVTLTTCINPDGSYLRLVDFQMEEETYRALGEGMEEFMNGIRPESALLEHSLEPPLWRYRLYGSSAGEIEALTNQLLQTGDAVFQVEYRDDGASPVQQMVVTQYADASYFADSAVTFEYLEIPPEYSYNSDLSLELSGLDVVRKTQREAGFSRISCRNTRPAPYSLVLVRSLPLDLIRVETVVSADGRMERTVRLLVEKERGSRIDALLRARISDRLNSRFLFSFEETGDAWCYTLSTGADGIASLNRSFNTLLAGHGSDTVVEGGLLDTGSFLYRGYCLSDSLDFSGLLGDIGSAGGIEYTVRYPRFQRPLSDSPGESRSNVVTAYAPGVSIRVLTASRGLSQPGLALLLLSCCMAALLLRLIWRGLRTRSRRRADAGGQEAAAPRPAAPPPCAARSWFAPDPVLKKSPSPAPSLLPPPPPPPFSSGADGSGSPPGQASGPGGAACRASREEESV